MDMESVPIEPLPAMTFDKVVTGTDTAGDGILNNAGETIDYDLVVTNTGNVTLTNVTLVDPLTLTDINIGDLAPDATHTESTSYDITQADLDSNGILEPDNKDPGFIDNTALANSDQTGEEMDMESVPIEPPTGPGTGQSPGFWKNHEEIFNQELEDLLGPDAYDQSYETVFDVTLEFDGVGRKPKYDEDPSLGEALAAKGGGEGLLLRASTSGLANANSDDLNFAYADLGLSGSTLVTMEKIDYDSNGVLSADEVINAVQDVYTDGPSATFATDYFDFDDAGHVGGTLNEMSNLPHIDAGDFM
jgi:uncharacterized repeat protein (TIGR01451 family)